MKTLVMVKPDGVKQGCIGAVIRYIEIDGFQITRIEMRYLALPEAELLYEEHRNQWYFDRNIKHVTSGPVVLIQVEGEDVIHKTRQIVEKVREKFEIELPRNLVHASSEENKALQELAAVGFLT